MTRHITSAPRALLLALYTSAVAACGEPPSDANGRFEATEVMVSAEAAGPLLALTVQDGDRVRAGDVIGAIDTVLLVQSRNELNARIAVLAARHDEISAQARVLQTQQALAKRELARIERLSAAGAATAQQLDRAQRDAATFEDQILATDASRRALDAERDAIAAQQGLLSERIRRTQVISPITGVVLMRYAEPGELVQIGAPLFKVAALDSLRLRAYVSDAQLREVSVGQMATVQVDDSAGSLRKLPARVTWISNAAEFTPTPIQTREERIAQVYAVTVVVANPDGRLRIGMPGELLFTPMTASTVAPTPAKD
jgi:HlyD family secretion protein